VLCRTLEGHAHWVNSIALNTDYVIRTGAVDPTAVHRGKGVQLNGKIDIFSMCLVFNGLPTNKMLFNIYILYIYIHIHIDMYNSTYLYLIKCVLYL
jgi:hypothetical protein